ELRVGGLCDEPRQRRLAGTRRSPQDEGVQLSGPDAGVERLTRREQRSLADELLEPARPHAIGERPQRLGDAGAHLRGVPITSAPLGGVKVTSPALTAPLRATLSNMMVAVWSSLSSRIMRFSSPLSKPNSASRKSASAPCGSTSTHCSPLRSPAGGRGELLAKSTRP